MQFSCIWGRPYTTHSRQSRQKREGKTSGGPQKAIKRNSCFMHAKIASLIKTNKEADFSMKQIREDYCSASTRRCFIPIRLPWGSPRQGTMQRKVKGASPLLP